MSMKAVRIHRFGGELRLEEVAVPEPKGDELLLRVHAAGINPVDRKMRDGERPGFLAEDQLPAILGREVSGVVERAGPDAELSLVDGGRFCAMLGFDRGAFAEYAIVRPSEWVPVPASLDHVAAAAVPLAGLTAWQGLFTYGGLQAGQRVLVHGGSGGVGHFAVQFARAKGATVYATSSAAHLDFLREIGADEAIDYKAQRFEEIARDIDVVLDLIGGETRERSWGVLKRGGILVSTLDEPDPARAEAEGVRATRFTAQPLASDLAQIMALVDAGEVIPHVAKTFPLAEAEAAQDCLAQGGMAGKIVMTIAG